MGEWTPAEKVQKCLNGTLAGKIALKLDANDGSKNQQISADIWNKFADEHGGKRINNSISAAHAMDSIMVYLLRESKKTGENVNDLAKKWLDGIGGENPTPVTPQKPEPKKQVPDPVNPAPVKPDPKVTPPKTDSNIPPKDDAYVGVKFEPPKYPPRYRIPAEKISVVPKKYINMIDEANANGAEDYKVEVPKFGTLCLGSDDPYSKHVWELKDKDGKVIQAGYTWGEVTEYHYNDKGLLTEEISRREDGTLSIISINYYYDDNGKMTGRLIFDPLDGEISEYAVFDERIQASSSPIQYEYRDGKIIRSIIRKLDEHGVPFIFYDFDENGNLKGSFESNDNRQIWRDADGTVIKYKCFEKNKNTTYDGKGEMLYYEQKVNGNWVKFKPDGSKYEE